MSVFWGRARGVFLALFLLLPLTASALTLTVINPGDTIAAGDGCTLREAIIAANTNAVSGDCGPGAAGSDTINFAIAGAGVHTIQPTSLLPVVTEPVIINGYSQPVASPNTLAVGNDAVLLIEIDGINAGSPGTFSGLLQISAGGSTVRGLVINRAQGSNGVGLLLTTNGSNTIAGNFIGIDPTGSIARGNGCQSLGIDFSSVNTIGGLTPADRNVIAGAGTVSCGGNLAINASSDNQILNNYLGTNAAGTAALGGGAGVVIGSFGGSSQFNIIGGTASAARNVISGNSAAGVNLFDVLTTGTLIQGNFIGTNALGTSAIPNGQGVRLGPAGVQGTLIGTAAPGSGNVIAFNTNDGVAIFGNPPPNGNSVLGNSIFSNGGLGIDINDDGVTANDAGDADTGPNAVQNFPVITAVTPGVGITTIQGTLNSTPASNFLLQFFSNTACDASGNGEGQTFLGTTSPGTVTTNGSGDVTFSVTVATVVSAGQVITATATNLGPAPITLSGGIRTHSPKGEIVSPGPTSEFSACFTVLGGPTATPTSTPTPTATPTATATATSIPPTPTNTVGTGPGGPPLGSIPTLSGGMLALLALALAGLGIFLMRRQ